jgi:hypothetical protein
MNETLIRKKNESFIFPLSQLLLIMKTLDS